MAGALTASIAAIFSGSAVSTDPYFNLTTLLLSTTASNTQQNNTFLDSSGINTITRVPSAGPNAPTQGTFSPFSQTGWSNYFDGTGDFINTPATGQFAPAGDFTIRFWFYLTSLAATNHLIGNYSAAATTDWLLEVTTGGVLQVFTNGSTLRLSQSGITANQWYYVTVTRTGTTITGQLFGSNFNTTATYTQSGTFGTATKSIYLGMRTGSTNPLTGYLVDVSLVDGSAIKTVPTAPLTAVPGTQLLTCQSNRFVDNSSPPNTLTIGGNTTIANLSPYNFTTPWSALTVGGSGYFDGTGDYLSTTVTVSDFYTALGDFTFEGWVYPLSFLGPQYSSPLFGFTNDDLMLRAMPTSATSTTLNIYGITSAGGPAFGSAGTSGGTIRLNEWAWVVFTRESGVLNLWVNGTRVVNNSTYTSIQLRQTATSLRIGSAFAGTPAPLWNGYLSGIKWTSGAALYSGATISMPTAPPTTTVSSGTNRLLLNFTNAGIYDATAKGVLETVGSAQVSTAQSKWAPTSMLFNGTTDYLQVNTASDLYNLVSGNWTIEAWVYRTSTATNKSGIITFLDNSTSSLSGWAFDCGGSNAGQLGFYSYNLGTIATNVSSSAGAVPINTWTYVAATCVGSTITIYINGTSVASGTKVGWTTNANCRLRIGGWNWSVALRYWQGYIQDPRITKGYARPITTPTAAFPVQGSLGAPASVEYLIIAGGGGGAGSGNLTTAGGGGAGGYRSSVAGESSGGGASAETTIAVYAGLTVTVTVGSGGAAGSDYYNGGGATTGVASSIAVASLTTISTVGGGIGAAGFAGAGNGGSGGGAMQASGAGTGTANQGYAGGLGNGAWSASGRGGGGGGAGGIGGTYTTGAGGTGGAGVTSSITGTAVTRAGGGGGSGGTGTGGTGTAGGGNGAVQTSPNGSPALPNTGSGGGASSAAAGGAAGGTGGQGGSGIVVIRYSSLYAAAAATTGSPTITVAGGYRVYTWTGNGSITF